MPTPNRFNFSNLFAGTKWNVFMLVFACIGLWLAGSFAWAAYLSSSWWALAWWSIAVIVFLDTIRTSSSRLWHSRKKADTGEQS